MAKKKKSKRKASNVWHIYKVDGDKLTVKNKICPKCGNGVFLAEHKDRWSCGRCGYAEFKNKPGS